MTVIQYLSENVALLVPLLIWSLIWKGLALWRSSRCGQLYWFIAMLVINSVGLLEIVYLLWFQKPTINQTQG